MTNGLKQKRKRKSRLRCPACGGSLSVDDNVAKTPHIMVRYRSCDQCEKRWVGLETLRPLDESDEPE